MNTTANVINIDDRRRIAAEQHHDKVKLGGEIARLERLLRLSDNPKIREEISTEIDMLDRWRANISRGACRCKIFR